MNETDQGTQIQKYNYMKKGDTEITCNACSSTFSLGSSTSTLRRHLNKCKQSIAAGWVVCTEDKPGDQPTLEEVLEPSLPFDQQKPIDDALTLWLKVKGKPLSLVEELEFNKFVKSLNRRYVVPSWYVHLVHFHYV